LTCCRRSTGCVTTEINQTDQDPRDGRCPHLPCFRHSHQPVVKAASTPPPLRAAVMVCVYEQGRASALYRGELWLRPRACRQPRAPRENPSVDSTVGAERGEPKRYRTRCRGRSYGREPRDPPSNPLLTAGGRWTGPAVKRYSNSRRIRDREHPNTAENGPSSRTRGQGQSTGSTTLRNLQNLHLRFKSGRRLQFPEGSLPRARSRTNGCLGIGPRWTTVHGSVAQPAALNHSSGMA
jgi:hypothetical protein